MTQIKERGFTAFVPSLEFIASFCESPVEQELNRRCIVESAKEILGRPWPFKATNEEQELFFRSSLLEQLRKSRYKELGVSDAKSAAQLLAKSPGQPWRLEINPCRRRWMRASVMEGAAYSQREQEVRNAQSAILLSEAAQLSREKLTESMGDPFGHIDVFRELMDGRLRALGFRYDAYKAREDFPVFSKPVNAEWALCWTLQDAGRLIQGAQAGRLKPVLDLRLGKLKGSADGAKTGEFLVIRYHQIIPGFNAYAEFHSFRELEVIVDAHTTLYQLMAPGIEDGIKSILW